MPAKPTFVIKKVKNIEYLYRLQKLNGQRLEKIVGRVDKIDKAIHKKEE